MKRGLILALSCWLLGFLVGCLEVEQQCTINADRSAKIRVTMAFDLGLLKRVQSSTGIDMGNEIMEAEDTMRSLVQQCFSRAQGVEAWTDYSLQQEEDLIVARMTAYTRDITHYVLNPEDSEVPNMTLKWHSTPEGHHQWQLHLPGVNDHPEDPLPPKVDAEELKEILTDRRRQFDEEAEESKVLFDALKIRSVLRFPSKVLATSNAEQLSRQEAAVTFSGKRFYAMMEKILADEDLAKRAFGQGSELHAHLALPGSQVNAWLFGENAPVTVTTAAGGRDLFDYEKELARAKASPPPKLIDDEP